MEGTKQYIYIVQASMEPASCKIGKTNDLEKIKPSLGERGLTPKDVLQKAKKVNNDEFYTRYEDIEKELRMYDKSLGRL